MTKPRKAAVLILVVLNAIVLTGQLWPEGAPPFAVAVNIFTLSVNIIFLIAQFRTKLL